MNIKMINKKVFIVLKILKKLLKYVWLKHFLVLKI